jgi:hypothetical protein
MDKESIYEASRERPNEFLDTSSCGKRLTQAIAVLMHGKANATCWCSGTRQESVLPPIQSLIDNTKSVQATVCHMLHVILLPVRSVTHRYVATGTRQRPGMIDTAAILLFSSLILYTVIRAIKLDKLLSWFSREDQQPPAPVKKKHRR